MDIYWHSFDKPKVPIDKPRLASFGDLFYEPFYQFLRQQLLAHEMELAHELEADLVTVLHVAPAKNRDFHRVTSPGLREFGDSSIEIWRELVGQSGRFVSVSTESLFCNFQITSHPELTAWWDYTNQRYS